MNTTKLRGVDVALNYARRGRFIFAIKYLEQENAGLARQDAIAAVASFGYRGNCLYGDNEAVDIFEVNRVRVL